MKLFSRKRALRAVTVWITIAVAASVLTTVERRRMRSSATTPAATPRPGALDGRALLTDIERLASPEFEGRRTGTPGSRAARAYIADRLRAAGVRPAFGAYEQPFAFTRRSIKGFFSPFRPYKTEYPEAANVGGVVPGSSRPERYLVVTAHYDGLGVRDGQLYPAADDNASGVAVLLGVGAVLARSPLAHSVLLLAFDAEELGIRGAGHFVDHSPVALEAIDVVVNLDMVGRGDANVLVAAGTSQSPELEAPVRAAAAGRTLQVRFGHDRPFYVAGLVSDWTHSSDHGPFHDAGVRFLYFGVDDHPDVHRPTDTADKVSAAFLGEVGNLVLDLLKELDVRK